MGELDVSRNTIARTKKKQAYREIVITELEQRKVTAATFAKNLKKLLTAKKTLLTKDGEEVKVVDNVTRFNALKKHGDILGVDAPKEFDLKHSMSAMGDDELQEAIDNSVEELDGRIKNQITGTAGTRIITTNTISEQKSTVARSAGEQAACPTNP